MFGLHIGTDGVSVSTHKGKYATMTKGVDMKIGSCGMSGHITNAITQFLYCLVLAMLGQYQAVGRYVRSLRRVVRFDLATVCSALALVCFSAVGALAQDGGDTTRPDVRFHNVPSPATHDGMTPFNVSVRFTEPVFEFTGGQNDIFFRLIGLPAGEDKLNYTPTVSNFVKTSSSSNEEIYTFTVTPISDYKGVQNNIRLDFEIQIPDRAARDIRHNPSWGTGTAQSPHLLMRYVAPNVAPVADAGDPQTVVSRATVTLDGSGSTDDDGIPEDTGLYLDPHGRVQHGNADPERRDNGNADIHGRYPGFRRHSRDTYIHSGCDG